MAKIYSVDLKCNKTGVLIKGQKFIGKNYTDIIDVMKEHCQDEDRSIMGNLSVVDDNFTPNAIEIDKNLTLDDFEEELLNELDFIGEERSHSESANDDDF